jgi:hypothetical protein
MTYPSFYERRGFSQRSFGDLSSLDAHCLIVRRRGLTMKTEFFGDQRGITHLSCQRVPSSRHDYDCLDTGTDGITNSRLNIPVIRIWNLESEIWNLN